MHFFSNSFRWTKKCHRTLQSGRRVNELQFIEKQFFRTRARLNAHAFRRKKRAPTSSCSFSGSFEKWRKRCARDREPLYLKKPKFSEFSFQLNKRILFFVNKNIYDSYDHKIDSDMCTHDTVMIFLTT